MKKKLLVVCGGQSSEHSISRISCNSVMKHLDKDYFIDSFSAFKFCNHFFGITHVKMCINEAKNKYEKL